MIRTVTIFHSEHPYRSNATHGGTDGGKVNSSDKHEIVINMERNITTGISINITLCRRG